MWCSTGTKEPGGELHKEPKGWGTGSNERTATQCGVCVVCGVCVNARKKVLNGKIHNKVLTIKKEP